jgi:hypothetical protein
MKNWDDKFTLPLHLVGDYTFDKFGFEIFKFLDTTLSYNQQIIRIINGGVNDLNNQEFLYNKDLGSISMAENKVSEHNKIIRFTFIGSVALPDNFDYSELYHIEDGFANCIVNTLNNKK